MILPLLHSTINLIYSTKKAKNNASCCSTSSPFAPSSIWLSILNIFILTASLKLELIISLLPPHYLLLFSTYGMLQGIEIESIVLVIVEQSKFPTVVNIIAILDTFTRVCTEKKGIRQRGGDERRYGGMSGGKGGRGQQYCDCAQH